MSNVDYKGSVTLISGLTQANNSSFPLVDGDAVQYKQEINEDGTFKSVSQKLSEFNRSYEYATSDDIDGILNGLFGQWKRLSLTEDTMLENTFEDQLKILSVNGNSYQPTSNNIVPTPEKPIPIISKKTNIKRISLNVFDLEKESDTSKIPDSGTYRSVGQHQLKANTKYVFSWSGATVPTKATLSFQIQDDKGTVLASPFTYFNLESAEKEEAGKEVEFTTNSSGIVKFAYNCTVGTSNTKETYQQYWYTKILKDITLKEDAEYESEYVELRSLKETGNLFDKNIMGFNIGMLQSNGNIGNSNYYAVCGYIPVKPNTKYTNNVSAISGFRMSVKVYFDKNYEAISNDLTTSFTTPENCYYIRYAIATTDTRLLTEEDISKVNNETMLVEGTSIPSSYIQPTIRDYKIIDHANKTAKIIRNVKNVRVTPELVANKFNDYTESVKRAIIYTRDRFVIDNVTKAGNDLSNMVITKYGALINGNVFSDVSGIANMYWYPDISMLGLNGSETKDVANQKLVEFLTNNEMYVQYQLANPTEEEITYVETDVSEVGYSWQDSTSPSPTIPSEIKGVDKVDITVTGKNLFDISKYQDLEAYDKELGCFTGNKLSSRKEYIGIDITDIWNFCNSKNKKITISFLIKTEKAGEISVYALGTRMFNMTKKIAATTAWEKHTLTYGLYFHEDDPNGDKCSLSFYGIYDSGVIPSVKDICISIFEENDLQYEPYVKPQYVSYDLDEPLHGINDVTDTIETAPNQRNNNLRVWVLDDNFTGVINLNKIEEKIIIFQMQIANIFNSNNIWCEQLKNESNTNNERFVYRANVLYIAIYKDRLETQDVAGFKKWLKDNPLTFVGSATTPTQETLPEDLPAELNKLKTNDGSTAIYINSEVKPSLNIEYKGT